MYVKTILFGALLMVVSCSSNAPVNPTPFVVSDTKVIVVGCEKLRKEVDDWNIAHPSEEQRVADC